MSFPLRVSNEGLLPVLTRPPSRRGDAAFPNRPAFNDTNDPSKLARFTFLAGGPIGLPLRASNEGLPRPRVARAQETNRLPSVFSIRTTS